MLCGFIDFVSNPKRRDSHRGYNRLLLLLAILAFTAMQCFFMRKSYIQGYAQGVQDCIENTRGSN